MYLSLPDILSYSQRRVNLTYNGTLEYRLVMARARCHNVNNNGVVRPKSKVIFIEQVSYKLCQSLI